MNNDTDWQSFGLGIIAIIGLVFFAGSDSIVVVV
jgi:hypothetical protein